MRRKQIVKTISSSVVAVGLNAACSVAQEVFNGNVKMLLIKK